MLRPRLALLPAVALVLCALVASGCGVAVNQRREAARVELAARTTTTTTLPVASPTIPQVDPQLVPAGGSTTTVDPAADPGGADPGPRQTPTTTRLRPQTPMCDDLLDFVKAGHTLVTLPDLVGAEEIRLALFDMRQALDELATTVPVGLIATAREVSAGLEGVRQQVAANTSWDMLRLYLGTYLGTQSYLLDNLLNSIAKSCPDEVGTNRLPPSLETFSRFTERG